MSTQKKVKENKKFPSIQEIEKFLTKLQPISENEQGVTIPIESYRRLGYTATAILKVLKTAMLTERDYPELAEHDKYDIYNLLHLAQNLVPEEEMELLDCLKEN